MSAIAASARALTPRITSRLIASSESSTICRALSQQRATLLRQSFSTSLAKRAAVETGPNGNPQLPKFNLRSIISNPRTRRNLIVLLILLGCIEGAAYYTFLPKMMGWDQKEDKKVEA